MWEDDFLSAGLGSIQPLIRFLLHWHQVRNIIKRMGGIGENNTATG